MIQSSRSTRMTGAFGAYGKRQWVPPLHRMPNPSGLRAENFESGFQIMKRLRASPHGIDLGPLQPCLPDRLPRRSDGAAPEIDIAPQEVVGDLARLRASLAETPPALVLIGRREMRTVNSWSHNLPSLVKGRMRCVLQIHPSDAEAHCIRSGDRVAADQYLMEVETDMPPWRFHRPIRALLRSCT